MVHCVGYGYRAPVACCSNQGFPKSAVGELNLASHATITTSASDDGDGPALVDGSKDYEAGKTWTVADPIGQTAEFDFGDVVEIVKVIFYNHNKAADTDVKDVALETSADGATWKKVLSAQLPDTAGATPNPQQRFGVLASARYWRVKIETVYESGKSSGFSEIELYKDGGGSDLNYFKKFAGHKISGHAIKTIDVSNNPCVAWLILLLLHNAFVADNLCVGCGKNAVCDRMCDGFEL